MTPNINSFAEHLVLLDPDLAGQELLLVGPLLCYHLDHTRYDEGFDAFIEKPGRCHLFALDQKDMKGIATGTQEGEQIVETTLTKHADYLQKACEWLVNQFSNVPQNISSEAGICWVPWGHCAFLVLPGRREAVLIHTFTGPPDEYKLLNSDDLTAWFKEKLTPFNDETPGPKTTS